MNLENQQGTSAPVQWSSGLCDCCSDCESCCIGYWVPSVLYGQNKEKIEGLGKFMPDCCAYFWLHLFCPCAVSCLSYQSRKNIRTPFNLEAKPCGDCCTHFWCMRCALCQEARELKFRNATPARPLQPQGAPVATNAPPMQTMAEGVPVIDKKKGKK
mmetsp:Transcript_10880/g.27469  ORF Transcript_10880/g.27469 Transcript_10880/m.27469 type:complete len:157 (+) Transcript_10880:226-696(+)